MTFKISIVENHEMPDDSDSSSTDSETSDDSYSSDNQTNWLQSTKYFNPSSNNVNNDDSNSTSDSENDDDDSLGSEDEPDPDWFKDYIAERIIQHKVDNSGKILYYVHWLDCPSEYDTWQTEKSFPPGFVMLDEYKSKHKLS